MSERPSGNLKASSHSHGSPICQPQPLLEPGRAGFLATSFSWQHPSLASLPRCPELGPILHPPAMPFLPGGKDSLQKGRSRAPFYTSCSITSRHSSEGTPVSVDGGLGGRPGCGPGPFPSAGTVAQASFCVQGAFLWLLSHIRSSPPHSKNSGRV